MSGYRKWLDSENDKGTLFVDTRDAFKAGLRRAVELARQRASRGNATRLDNSSEALYEFARYLESVVSKESKE